MELHRYPQEKPQEIGSYLVYQKWRSSGDGFWTVMQWTGKKKGWCYWSDYYDCDCYPGKDVKYWAELPEIPNDK